ncbi:MAG: hypothetical protein GW949_00085 [Spirochaetales bacterium]|nr:hypothetical protein [Spirochaetales bacterium]
MRNFLRSRISWVFVALPIGVLILSGFGVSRTPLIESSPEVGNPVPTPPTRAVVNVRQNVVYADRFVLYLSQDRGQTWDTFRPLEEVNTSLYMTAAAVNPADPNHLVVASSYQGLYESKDRGITWDRLDHSSLDRVLYQGARFYDEIAALWISESDPASLLIRKGFSDQWYRWSWTDRTLTPIGNPQALLATYPDLPPSYVTALELSEDATDIWFERKFPFYEASWPVPDEIRAQRENHTQDYLEPDARFWERRELAANRTGIYLNPWQAGNNLDDHLQFVLDHGMNSIIVDFKDDYGQLTYDSNLSIVERVGSEYVRFDARELIRKAHEKGIYVIARQVVFKDRTLARYLNGRYSLWDTSNNRPWGVFRQETPEATTENPNPEPRWVQIEYWVDAHADFVHQYNIAIAQELQNMGVDEIQFDYIRFPSDGLTRNIRSRFFTIRNSQNRPQGYQDEVRSATGSLVVHPELLVQAGWSDPVAPALDTIEDRVLALQTFLRKARQVISKPISVDVFGFNAWARMGYLGQDIEAMSFYVDVIAPMAYPSHYARDFLPELTYFQRAYALYDTGTYRARSIVGDRVLIRPWVQAFLIGGELRYEKPEYTEYLNLQIRGTMAGGGSGFSLWNNSGRYYMIDRDSFWDAWGEGRNGRVAVD